MASSIRSKYERALEFHLRLVRTELLKLKAEVCEADAEKVDEIISVLDCRVAGPWNIEEVEKRFREIYPEFEERASGGRQKIELDCPPGDPRPDDLIGEVIKGTGLPSRVSEGVFMGHASWDYSDVSSEVWKKARRTLVQRILRLYRNGTIRYGCPARE